ncbi:MAG: diguanylate cyclase, partial [Gammaproteobacteria bacterium]|nr:diguanylate cyclase [Gammaproteobacteria bacterium]
MQNNLYHSDVTKILVIDDDPVTRMMLSKTLTKSGYDVKDADSGEKGLEIITTFVPEIVLLDVMMPGMDGYETCSEIRKIYTYNEMPVIMLTGLNDESSVDKAFTIGANDFVTKPINWSLLVKRVKYLVRDKIINMQLVENEARLRQSQRIAKIFYWELNPENYRITISDTFKKMTGLSCDKELEYTDYLVLMPEDERQQLQDYISNILKTGKGYNIDHHIKCKDGKECIFKQYAEAITGKNGEIISVIGTLQDITEQRNAESLIEYQRYYDGLTTLPNKKLFCKTLDSYIRKGKNEVMIAVIMLGIDRFKKINESLGHQTGDVILKSCGERIKNILANRAFVAYGGGDRFSILLNNISNLEYVEKLVEEVNKSLTESFTISGEIIHITCSIGITIHPMDENSSSQLLENAEFAMNKVKETGGANYSYYSPELNKNALRKRELEKHIRYAIDN